MNRGPGGAFRILPIAAVGSLAVGLAGSRSDAAPVAPAPTVPPWERTLDPSGVPAVSFTSEHIAFRQSLLVRAADAGRLGEYPDLTSQVRVGVLVGTTGEARLLRITGLADADGVLITGAEITTPDGVLVADGSADYRIAADRSSERLVRRALLVPPSAGLPQVVFSAADTIEVEQIRALRLGAVDALARGEIGNRPVERNSLGTLAVSALDDGIEPGGFTLGQSEAVLFDCLDDKLDGLTDRRSIGYAEWPRDPSVFLARAAAWTP